jgi:hypothetical protein
MMRLPVELSRGDTLICMHIGVLVLLSGCVALFFCVVYFTTLSAAILYGIEL